MWKTFQAATVMGLFALLALCQDTGAQGAEPAHQIRSSVSALNRWLSLSAGGPTWRKFLKSDQLEAELAKGAAADKAVVSEVLAIYNGQTAGLDRPQFAAVRAALETWLAELSVPNLAELPAAARAAADQFQPVDVQREARAKERLQAALTDLDAWLARSGEKTSAGWKSFLGWDEMQMQLTEGTTPEARALDAVVAKYRSNASGLELARFTNVRDALRAYGRAIEYSSGDKLKEEFPKQLEQLALRLEASAKSGTGDDAAAAGRIIGWLEQAGQTPALVSAVRRNYSRPNLFAHASADLIDAAVAENVDQVTPVREYILKTNIEGMARTTGRIRSALVPSANSAALDILLLANTYTDSLGYQGPVTIHSTGNTSVYARKRLIVDAQGVRSLPAAAVCTTTTDISRIDAPLRIIERIAWKKAGKSQGQAEQIASGKAQARVAAQMDARVAELVVKANSTFVDKFRKPLLRRGEYPKSIQLATYEDRLTVRMQQANATQLAASDAPPESKVAHDLAVRVHESLVTNFAESAIGGETLTDKRLAGIMKEATGNVPEELQLSPDKDPWSITFHEVQPVTASFSDQQVKLAIRGQRFTRGENIIKEAMQISAVYKIERTGNGVKFVRQGDVVVDFVEKPARLSVTQIAFKTFMRRKFSALFKEEIDRGQDGLALPGRLERLGKLPLDVLTADKGWLVAGWKLPAKTRTAHAPSN